MKQAKKYWGVVAALNGLVAIAMGAVAAHAIPDAYAVTLAEKASSYQLAHALLLLVLMPYSSKLFTAARCAIAVGILFFCGALYIHALTGNIIMPLAPVGGTCLMAGWAFVAAAFYKGQKNG